MSLTPQSTSCSLGPGEAFKVGDYVVLKEVPDTKASLDYVNIVAVIVQEHADKFSLEFNCSAPFWTFGFFYWPKACVEKYESGPIAFQVGDEVVAFMPKVGGGDEPVRAKIVMHDRDVQVAVKIEMAAPSDITWISIDKIRKLPTKDWLYTPPVKIEIEDARLPWKRSAW